MEVDIGHGCWKDLHQLRSNILNGTRTASVKRVEKSLMKGLADAIARELQRSEVKEVGELRDDLMLTVELNVQPWVRKSSGPEKARSGISLIAQLDDALTEKTKKRKELLSW